MRPALGIVALPLVALTLAGCVAPGGEEASGAARLPLAEAAARLPAEAVGFLRRGSTELESRHPGDGIGVDYATATRSAGATVHVYDRGLERVPSDPSDPVQRAEFDRAVREVMALPAARTGRRFTERERERSVVAMPGGAGLNCATLRGALGRENVRQLVCIGGAGGRFLRLQVTMLDRTPPPADAAAFVVAVTQAARGR